MLKMADGVWFELPPGRAVSVRLIEPEPYRHGLEPVVALESSRYEFSWMYWTGSMWAHERGPAMPPGTELMFRRGDATYVVTSS